MISPVFIAFGAYIIILLTIGILSHKKHTSELDFVIGNRGINYWVTALSAHASDMSSWLFMGFPAAIFLGGLPQIWIAVSLIFGMFLCWQFIAPKIRVATEEYQCYTLSGYLEKRFNDQSGIIRMVSAIMVVIFTINYLAVGYTAMGFIFEDFFGINYYVGISIAVPVITAYIFYGGFATVAITDLFQALFLLCVLLLVPFLALANLDNGWTSVVQATEKQQLSLSFLPEMTLVNIVGILFLALKWGLGYFGQPHIITKFLGIKRVQDIPKSKYVGLSWQFLALSAATLVGVIGIAYFPGGLDNSELVFIKMVKSLFSPFIGSFILCAILAAIISTMDSQILVSASILTEDIYKTIFHKKGGSNSLLKISRINVIIVSTLGYLISLKQNKTIMEMVSYSWTGLGCSFGPLLLMSLYYKKMTKSGALAGILCGGMIAAFWERLEITCLGQPVPAMIPGFLIAVAAIVVVSNIKEQK